MMKMNLVKRSVVVSVAAAGLVVGGAGFASADNGNDSTDVDHSGNITDVLDLNDVVGDVTDNVNGDNLNGNNLLNGNSIVLNDLLDSSSR